MPGRKRPTPEDAATARRALLDWFARDADILEILSELAPQHPRNDTFPGEVFLHLAADALEWCGASRAEPLPLAGLRERFLPECAFRGRQNAKLQYAVLAAAAVHGGTEPDLLDEVGWWQSDDFWQYAMYAAIAYIRAAASRAGGSVSQACQDLNDRPGHPAPRRIGVAGICVGRLPTARRSACYGASFGAALLVSTSARGGMVLPRSECGREPRVSSWQPPASDGVSAFAARQRNGMPPGPGSTASAAGPVGTAMFASFAGPKLRRS